MLPPPTEALVGSEVVFLMLGDAPAIDAVLFVAPQEPDLNGRTIFQMATIAPDESRRLAAALKLAMNQLIASLTTSFSLGLGFVRRSGIDVNLFMHILRKSALDAPTFDKKLPKMLTRDFVVANFPTRHLLKDVLLMTEEARQQGLETVALRGVEKILQRAVELGHADWDCSALYEAVDPP